MDWDDLRLLETASRAASLADLAQEMRADPTTVSRRMKQMEDRIGLVLFERMRGKLVLTPQARHLCRHLAPMADAASSFLHGVRALHVAPEGTVAVSAPPTLARHVIAPAVSRLAERAPKVTLDLRVQLTNVRLERLEADIAVRMGSPVKASESVRFRRVGALPYAVFAPATVDSDRWVAYPEAFATLPEAAWVEARLAGRPAVMRVSDPIAMAEAVASGVGQALLPVMVGTSVRGIVQRGDAVVRKDIHLLRRPEPAGRSVTGLVYEWLIECLAKENLS